MFKCKVCIEKDQRISELKDQISYFKNILNPPQRIQKYELQEGMLLDGANVEEIDPARIMAEAIESDKIRRESDMIFTGNDIEVEEEVG